MRQGIRLRQLWLQIIEVFSVLYDAVEWGDRFFPLVDDLRYRGS